jgi:hypothetical protein
MTGEVVALSCLPKPSTITVWIFYFPQLHGNMPMCSLLHNPCCFPDSPSLLTWLTTIHKSAMPLLTYCMIYCILEAQYILSTHTCIHHSKPKACASHHPGNPMTVPVTTSHPAYTSNWHTLDLCMNIWKQTSSEIPGEQTDQLGPDH